MLLLSSINRRKVGDMIPGKALSISKLVVIIAELATKDWKAQFG